MCVISLEESKCPVKSLNSFCVCCENEMASKKGAVQQTTKPHVRWNVSSSCGRRDQRCGTWAPSVIHGRVSLPSVLSRGGGGGTVTCVDQGTQCLFSASLIRCFGAFLVTERIGGRLPEKSEGLVILCLFLLSRDLPATSLRILSSICYKPRHICRRTTAKPVWVFSHWCGVKYRMTA